MCPGPGPALGSAATSGKCSRSDGIKSPWKSSSQRVRTCEHNTKVPGSFLLHRGHEMFRDTPVSPYLDSNSDNKATRPAFIHLWVGNWVLEQRETRPLPKMSPNLPLNSAKMNEISCCLINFKRGDKLEIMLAAYTIQLWFPPCLGGFTGGGGASRIRTVQTSCVNNVPCNRNLLSSSLQATFAMQQVWD